MIRSDDSETSMSSSSDLPPSKKRFRDSFRDLSQEELAEFEGFIRDLRKKKKQDGFPGLAKSDSNDDRSQRDPPPVLPLKLLFANIPALKVSPEDHRELPDPADPPTKHVLNSTLGIMYRGIPKNEEGKEYWEKRAYKVHTEVMCQRIAFTHPSRANVIAPAENDVVPPPLPNGPIRKRRGTGKSGAPAPTVTAMPPRIDLSLYRFWEPGNEPAGFTDELLEDNKVLQRLLHKWPLIDGVGKSGNGGGKNAPDVWTKHEVATKSTVITCIRSLDPNNLGKKVEMTTGKCKCGPIFASIAKGKHEMGTNPHLKFSAIAPFLPKLNDFYHQLRANGGKHIQTKELLCYHCRIFLVTNVWGANKNKYALIGSDQRCYSKHESDGCQAGVLAFCLDFQRFLFGEWDGWARLDDHGFSQVLPSEARAETLFHNFQNSCLEYPGPKLSRKILIPVNPVNGSI